MFSLNFLTVPLIAAFATFGLAVFTDYQTVFFDRIAVPPALASSTGYSSDVVVMRLADGMREIERQASSEVEARQLRFKGDHSVVNVIGDFLKVTPLIRVAQGSAGLIPFTFEGELVSNGRELELRLRGHDAHHRAIFLAEKAPLDQFPALLNKVAFEIMREIDPYLLAAYQFKQDYRQRDFTDTLEIIQHQVARSHGHPGPEVKFLENLWGIVLYQQGDRSAAIHKFEEALHLDPKFLSPRLNWGVVLARQGEHDQAISKFKDVVKLGAGHPEAANTVAAAYTEWGFSLALLSQWDEAFAKFKQAKAVSPGFADVYSSWAEVLSVLGRKEEAAKMTAQALELAPNEVIYTENLIGPVQNLPAAAVIQ